LQLVVESEVHVHERHERAQRLPVDDHGQQHARTEAETCAVVAPVPAEPLD